MQRIQRVALVGGTHGNELIGAWLVRKFSDQPELVRRSSFETLTVLGNPKAVSLNRRYADQDLNRSFATAELERPDTTAYEAERAKVLWHRLGPNGETPADVIFDLHTTTANMGLSLVMVKPDPFNLKLACFLRQKEPRVRVYCWLDEALPRRSLNTLAPKGFVIEVGPTANSIVRGDLFRATERLVGLCLDFVQAHNEGQVTYSGTEELECFSYLGTIDFPRDASGQPVAYIHPSLQDRDFQPLRPGEPLFETLSGETLVFEHSRSEVYPVFINEAAYYEKGVALCLTERKLLRV